MEERGIYQAITMLINFAIGALARLFTSKQLIWLALAWLFLSVLWAIFFGALTGGVFIGLLIKTALVFAWLVLLKNFDDTIFVYLLILAGGAYLLTLF